MNAATKTETASLWISILTHVDWYVAPHAERDSESLENSLRAYGIDPETLGIETVKRLTNDFIHFSVVDPAAAIEALKPVAERHRIGAKEQGYRSIAYVENWADVENDEKPRSKSPI